jgi:ABC-2 type transport system permease protein
MNKLIHKGYFKEIFRQLRVVGIVGAAILMLSNITTAINLLGERDYLFQGYVFPSAQSMASTMMLFVYIMGTALTFTAFGWLNKRSTSDYYHAIPVTRTQMYFSSILAIMIWMFIGLTAYALVHALVYLLLGAPFNYLLFLCVFINMLIAALEVVGAASIACAISGTRFVNLFATAVILFLPRFLTTVIMFFMNRLDCPSLVIPTISPLFDPTYNIIATPYMSILSVFDGEISVDFANVGAMIYTLVYSIILVVAGWIAFKKRKSEAAGVPTTNRFFQGVIRTAVGLPFLLVLAFLIVDDTVSLGNIVILALLAFVFYCLYELISTKSAKKMLKAMPLFLICVAISALFVFIPGLIEKGEYTVKVNESNVKSFTVEDNEYAYAQSFMGMSSTSSYSEIIRSRVVFDDPESIAILVKAYNRCNGKDSGEFYKGVSETETITINRRGRNITRNVSFTPSEYARLTKLREGYADYVNANRDFPKGTIWFYASGLNAAQSREVGEIFREEYNALPVGKREMLEGGSVIVLYGCLGTENYSSSFSMNENTPRAAERYIQLLNENNGEQVKDRLKVILDWMETGSGYQYFSILDVSNNEFRLDSYMMKYEEYIYDEKTDTYYESHNKPIESDPEYYALIKMLYDAPLAKSAEKAVILYLDHSNFSGEDNYYISNDSVFNGYFALELTKDQVDLLLDYYNEFYGGDYYGGYYY